MSGVAEKYEMIKAIHEQPLALSRVFEKEFPNIRAVTNIIKSNKIESFHLVGIGTSFHAAKIGEHFLRVVARKKNVSTWNSFDFANSGVSLSKEDCVLVVSHRGSKQFSAASLKLAQQNKAISVLITGQESQGDPADAHVISTCRQETSSAHTISYTSALFVLLLLALELRNEVPQNYKEITEQLPQHIQRVISSTEVLALRVAKSLAPHFAAGKDSHLYLVGWGLNTWTAFEIALKIKETSYLLSEGLQIEQYLHGPFCATSNATVVIFIAPRGYGTQRTIDLIRTVKHVGAKVVLVSDDVEKYEGEVSEEERIQVPTLTNELDSPETALSHVVPLQLLTYHLALQLGTNPDTFRSDQRLFSEAEKFYRL